MTDDMFILNTNDIFSTRLVFLKEKVSPIYIKLLLKGIAFDCSRNITEPD